MRIILTTKVESVEVVRCSESTLGGGGSCFQQKGRGFPGFCSGAFVTEGVEYPVFGGRVPRETSSASSFEGGPRLGISGVDICDGLGQ